MLDARHGDARHTERVHCPECCLVSSSQSELLKLLLALPECFGLEDADACLCIGARVNNFEGGNHLCPQRPSHLASTLDDVRPAESRLQWPGIRTVALGVLSWGTCPGVSDWARKHVLAEHVVGLSLYGTGYPALEYSGWVSRSFGVMRKAQRLHFGQHNDLWLHRGWLVNFFSVAP